MKRLLLMRHAKTENWYQGTDDESRALVPRGRDDARLMSEALAGRRWVPDKVIMSSARRTRETWKAMSGTLPGIGSCVLEEMYLISPDALLALISTQWQDADTLLVIGHNPGLQELAGRMADNHAESDAEASRSVALKMPTCATALFDFDDRGEPLEHSLILREFIIAKNLRSV